MRTALPILLLALPLGASAQQGQPWSWSGTVPRGQVIEIKGVNGEIRASLASGSQVKVTATKTGKRSDPASVQIQVVEHAGGITICSVYPTPENRQPNECRPGTGGRNHVDRNDVSVEYVVEVPRDTRAVLRTVNGAVRATGLQSDVEAVTVNGEVHVGTTGLAKAHTVNGGIDVAMGRTDWSDELELETVNGGITVEFGSELNAEVHASTTNGDIETDYPLTVRGKYGPRRLSGTVGKGGRQLSLSTVNGSIEIRRR